MNSNTCSMFVDGKDQGYLDDKNWWFNANHPQAFRIAKLNEDYPAEYFPLAEPPKDNITELVNFVYLFCESVFKTKVDSVIEFGCAGGWIGEEFKNKGIGLYVGVEGSLHGSNEAKKRLGNGMIIINHDLRKPFEWHRVKEWFNLAICTELAEHLEVPFHGILVRSLTHNSNLVWFSSEGPEIDNRPHLHHPGEMPLRYWINLFEFFGFGCYMLPDSVYEACAGRGRCIFYNKQKYQL